MPLYYSDKCKVKRLSFYPCTWKGSELVISSIKTRRWKVRLTAKIYSLCILTSLMIKKKKPICKQFSSSCPKISNVSMQSSIIVINYWLSIFLSLWYTILLSIIGTYKRSICNIQSRRVATSHNAQKHMHWNKINNKCVPSPWTNLKDKAI